MTVTDLELTLIDGEHFEAVVTDDGYELVITTGEQFTATFGEGIPGPRGPQGDPGPPGGDFEYVFEQNVAAQTWVISHPLGGFPNVTFVDTLDREFNGEKHYDSPDQITATFAIAMTGRALLS